MTNKEIGPTLPISKWVYDTKYLKNESFKDGMVRVANALKEDDEHFLSFREVLYDQRFLPGGRVMSAMGASETLTPYNCYVMDTIPDSWKGIHRVLGEAGETMRMGGGVGYDFSTLRPRGANIASLGSESSGPVSFMDIFSSMCACISSAGHRRGAQMGVLRVDHPDIEEFINAKTNEHRLKQFNISVAVTDEFMEAVKNDAQFDLRFEGRVYRTVSATALWDKIMRSTWDWAEPGVLFIDRINRKNNLHYCETIAATNPCLHPDSMVETTEGRVRIKDMNRPMRVYCMDHDGNLTTSMASPSWLSKSNTETVKIKVDSGKELICTPDHLIYVIDKGYVKAQDLKKGERVGHLCRTKKSEYYSRVKLNVSPDEPYVSEHRFVASSEYSLTPDFDVHHIDGDTFNNSIHNLEVLTHEDHSVVTNTGADKSSMVRDEEGRFVRVPKLKEKQSKDMPTELRSNLVNQFSGKVVSVEFEGYSDVYDLHVEEYHNFIANFMVVHNCGEQPLPPYGACLLGSFNLTKYLTEDNGIKGFNPFKMIQDIKVVYPAMDNIIDRATYPLDRQREEAHNKRRMGLGITGLANTAEILGMPYGSSQMKEFTANVMTLLRNTLYKCSIERAIEKGPFPLYNEKLLDSEFAKTLPKEIRDGIQKYGIRNSHLLSIAPTGTISIAANNVSSGIEPVFALEYTRKVQEFDGMREEKVQDYAYREFGVEGRTSDKVSAKDHVGILTLVSGFVDSACSKTCNVGSDVTWEDFKEIYMQAYDGGASGCTTYRSAGNRGGILTTEEHKPNKEEQMELEFEGGACEVDPVTGVRSCE